MKMRLSHLIILMMLSLSAQAAPPTASKPTPQTQSQSTTQAQALALSPQALSAKSLLEDLLIKRYTGEVGTRLLRNEFSLSAKVELAKLPEEEIPAVEPLDDLALGHLDPDALIKKLSPRAQGEYASGILSQFQIQSVAVTLGLATELGEAKKKEIHDWFTAKVNAEFGAKAKTESFLFEKLTPAPTPTPAPNEPTEPASFLKTLKDFQDLAGKLALAAALIVGALLWGILSRPKQSSDQSVNLSGGTQQDGGAGSGGSGQDQSVELSGESSQKSDEDLSRSLREYSTRIQELEPKYASSLGPVLRNWCDQKAPGYLKIVCLADALGKNLTQLPIPEDAKQEISKAFRSMPSLSLADKKTAVESAYWDLLTVINLGEDSLSTPFSYLSSLRLDSLSEVMMNHNPRIKTLVSLYMPEDLRQQYVSSLEPQAKLDLLQASSELNEISNHELQKTDHEIATRIRGQSSSRDIIRLDLTLKRIVDALSPREALTLLRQVQGPQMQLLKSQFALPAFLEDWRDESLQRLLSKVPVQSLVAYLAVKPDLTDRFLALCPPMTQNMAKDELSQRDKLSDNQINQGLVTLASCMVELCEAKEIDLAAEMATLPETSAQAA